MRLSRMIRSVEVHAAGEPGRVIVGGVLDPPGGSVYEKMRHLEAHGDALRQLMLNEPRGYPAMCCNLLVAPGDPRADAGFIIMEPSEYAAMSGSNTICVATVLVETGMVPVTEPVTRFTLEAPAGLVEVSVRVEEGRALSVTFDNVPAFAVHLDAALEVPELGRITVDVAWGGMFYVIADAEALGIPLEPDSAERISRVGEMLRAAAAEQLEAVHPLNPGIRGVSISQLTGPPSGPHADGRNAVVVSTGALDRERPGTWRGVLDRSPCGTGTCARMAAMHARGRLGLGEPFRHEGILGSVFTGELVEETRVGDRPAVVPRLTGSAWITGFSQHVLDPADPFPEGFRVADIWGQGRR